MADPIITIRATPEQACDYAAGRFAELLADRGGSVALAGGRTPAALYQLLCIPPHRDRVRWSNIEWFWGDERAVPADHVDSNQRMARAMLLDPLGIPGRCVHPMPAMEADLDRAAYDYEALIRSLVPANGLNVPAFDLILLGMGSDGHTASLFPGTSALNEQNRLVVPNFVASMNAWRMTMTYRLLHAAKHLLFLVTGSAKAAVVKQVLGRTEAGSTLPAAIACRGARGQVEWVLDQSAAALLE